MQKVLEFVLSLCDSQSQTSSEMAFCSGLLMEQSTLFIQAFMGQDRLTLFTQHCSEYCGVL